MGKKVESILTNDMCSCMECGRTDWIEKHHVFGGANRKWSQKYKLIVPLCHYCHNEPPTGIHFNKEMAAWYHEFAQRRFEEEYPDLIFQNIFGRNYKQ